MLKIARNLINAKIKMKLIAILLIIIASVLILVVAIASIGGVLEEISNFFFGWLKDNDKAYSDDVLALKDWSESAEFKEYYEDIMTKDKFDKYIEYEMKSWGEKIKLSVPVIITETIREPGREDFVEVREEYEDYYLDLYSATKEYGVPWQLFAVVDIFKDQAIKKDTAVIDYMDSKLKTEYYGLYDKKAKLAKFSSIKNKTDFMYYKTVTYKKTERVKTEGGSTVTYITEKVTKYPLPYFHMIKTYIHTTTNHYKKQTDIVTDIEEEISDEDKTTKIRILETVEQPVLRKTTVSTDMVLLASTLSELNIYKNDIESLKFFLESLPYGDSLIDVFDALYWFLAEDITFSEEYYGKGDMRNVIYNFSYPNLRSKDGQYYRDDIIKTAESILGLDYFWGGKYFKKGYNPRWGIIRYEKTYGRYQRYGLDCSGFVDWVYVNVTGRSVGKGGGTVSQWAYTKAINRDELEVGDLGFYKMYGGKHVGIFIGRDSDGTPMFIHAGGSTWGDDKHPRGQVIISKLGKSYKGYPPVKFQYFRRVGVDFVEE
ncbi:C40 family peptidase [Wukongibacter baidiensis]